jgi:Senescence regulator
MEELLESEVMWPENLHADAICYKTNTNPNKQHTQAANYSNSSITSTPIAIPGTSNTILLHDRSNRLMEECIDEQVPPHVLMSRKRNTENLAFPLCSGHGRTLKGRDLSDVRNTVWRMTGFLDG